MRRRPKFSIIAKSPFEFHKFPKKILNFKRPKWAIIKKKNLLPKATFLVNSFSIKKPFFSWEKLTQYPKKSLLSRRFMKLVYDDSKKVMDTYFHKNLSSSKRDLILSCIIKNDFCVDVLIYNLNLCSSIYEARQQLLSGIIKVNGITKNPSYMVKRGDIISFGNGDYSLEGITSTFLYQHKMLPFIEFDYYSNSFLVIKDFSSLSEEDFYLLITKSTDLRHFTYR
jgi:ribosomal protein S4